MTTTMRTIRLASAALALFTGTALAEEWHGFDPVSYTHLTLPTTERV